MNFDILLNSISLQVSEEEQIVLFLIFFFHSLTFIDLFLSQNLFQ